MTGKFNYQTTYFWTAGDTHNKVKYKEPTDKKNIYNTYEKQSIIILIDTI